MIVTSSREQTDRINEMEALLEASPAALLPPPAALLHAACCRLLVARWTLSCARLRAQASLAAQRHGPDPSATPTGTLGSWLAESSAKGSATAADADPTLALMRAGRISLLGAYQELQMKGVGESSVDERRKLLSEMAAECAKEVTQLAVDTQVMHCCRMQRRARSP